MSIVGHMFKLLRQMGHKDQLHLGSDARIRGHFHQIIHRGFGDGQAEGNRGI